ncbi:MAG: hypothetical protein R3C53_03860 [Pirellulaceae bacterium]
MLKRLAVNLLIACVAWPTLFNNPPGLCRAEEPAGVEDGFRVDANDWPWWRGSHRNGTADAAQSPPVEFSETSGVLWKTPVPGRGHGSPMVWANKVVLVTCDESSGSQSVLCFDRADGRQLWESVVHEKGGHAEEQ